MGYKKINGQYVQTMRVGEQQFWMSGYLTAIEETKNKQLGWDIQMTTKRNPKQTDYTAVDGKNYYTLFLLEKGTDSVYMKSDEFEGYHKNSWSEYELKAFIKTLKKV